MGGLDCSRANFMRVTRKRTACRVSKRTKGGEEESTPRAEGRQSPQPRREGACLICVKKGLSPYRADDPSFGLSVPHHHEMTHGQQLPMLKPSGLA